MVMNLVVFVVALVVVVGGSMLQYRILVKGRDEARAHRERGEPAVRRRSKFILWLCLGAAIAALGLFIGR